MKNARFFIAVLLFSAMFYCSAFGAYLPITKPPWWAGKDPTKDIIITVLIETERTTYAINEVVLSEIPISAPKGLEGSISLVVGGSENKIVAYSILPSYILGKTGCQVEIPIMETKSGTYSYKAKYLSEGRWYFSNEVTITFTEPELPLPSLGSQKTETAIIDYYQYWWSRTLVADKNRDGIADWDKPMPIGTARPTIQLAPSLTPSGKTSTTWSKIKQVGR